MNLINFLCKHYLSCSSSLLLLENPDMYIRYKVIRGDVVDTSRVSVSAPSLNTAMTLVKSLMLLWF